MNKITEIKPVYVEFVPDELQEGILYISNKYNGAMHLCACGCGKKVYTRLDISDGWTLADANGMITLRPSIGNWKGENPYHAHYLITSNKIEWL